MRIGSIILALWLLIGIIAASQRSYFTRLPTCASVGTVVVTIAAGPLNFAGVNPRVSCR